MPKGDGRSSGGFWTTTLGFITQIGIILSAIAGIVAGIVAITGDGPGPVVPTPTATATPANGVAEQQLPEDCAAEIAVGSPRAAGSDPEVLEPIRVYRRPSAITTGGNAVWVAHKDGHITRIRYDTSDSHVEPLQNLRVGSSNEGEVSIAFDYGFVWVTKKEGKSGVLAKIDPRRGPRSMRNRSGSPTTSGPVEGLYGSATTSAG
jgi:hypothetical protein